MAFGYFISINFGSLEKLNLNSVQINSQGSNICAIYIYIFYMYIYMYFSLYKDTLIDGITC